MRKALRVNAEGIRTVRGGRWAPENVRKLVGHLPRENGR